MSIKYQEIGKRKLSGSNRHELGALLDYAKSRHDITQLCKYVPQLSKAIHCQELDHMVERPGRKRNCRKQLPMSKDGKDVSKKPSGRQATGRLLLLAGSRGRKEHDRVVGEGVQDEGKHGVDFCTRKLHRRSMDTKLPELGVGPKQAAKRRGRCVRKSSATRVWEPLCSLVVDSYGRGIGKAAGLLLH